MYTRRLRASLFVPLTFDDVGVGTVEADNAGVSLRKRRVILAVSRSHSERVNGRKEATEEKIGRIAKRLTKEKLEQS